jgi:hypothetical protein
MLAFAMIFSIIPTLPTLPTVSANQPSVEIEFEWDLSEEWPESVTQMGTGSNVMQIDLPEFTDAEKEVILGSTGGSLDFTLGVAYDTSRRIVAWTNLSGTEEDGVADYAFASPANQAAGTVAVNSGTVSGLAADVSLLQGLFYDSETEAFADTIYVLITTNAGGGAFNLPDSQRGNTARGGLGLEKEFDIFDKIVLSFIALGPCEVCDANPCECVDENLIAGWEFTTVRYPAAPVGIVPAGTPIEEAGVKEFIATHGNEHNVGAAKLVRHEADPFPGSSPATKHLTLHDGTGDRAGFMRAWGWNHPDNFVYLDVNTVGRTQLGLSFDYGNFSNNSVPDILQVQYSLDGGERWINVRGRGAVLNFRRQTDAGGTEQYVDSSVVALPEAAEGQESLWIRWLGNSHNNGTSGFVSFRDIRVFSGYEPPPPCACNLDECEECNPPIHIFPFPLDLNPTQVWAGGVIEGWDSNNFGGALPPSPANLARAAADIRYMVFEFVEPPENFGIRFQDAGWWPYPLDLVDEVTEEHGQKLRDPSATRIVIDFEEDLPPRPVGEGMPVSEARPFATEHDGFSAATLFGFFQLLIHTDTSEDGRQNWQTFMGKLSTAYLTNVHPDRYEPLPETQVQAWESLATHAGGRINTTTMGREDLKLYYDYTATGVGTEFNAVRMQFSVDNGSTWNNIHSSFSIITPPAQGAAPEGGVAPPSQGKRMEILPREVYNQDSLQIRWIPHGLWGEAEWNAGTFNLSNIRLVSGKQRADVPRSTSQVLGIGRVDPREYTVVQRGTTNVALPEINFRPGNLDNLRENAVWTSTNTNIARVIETNAGATIRGLRAGTATIRVATAEDQSVYTDFRVTVTAIPVEQGVEYKITSPYAEVDWGTYSTYKAGLHTHSQNSDGANGTNSLSERHYELGFNVVALTDHTTTAIWPDRVNTGALTPERIAEMAAGAGRDGNGMLFIPGGNEHNATFEIIAPGSHHFNTYWSFLPSVSGQPVRNLIGRIEAENRGGLVRINHKGRYTGSQWETPWAVAESIANSSAMYQPYAQLYLDTHNLVGMEIINKFDTETQADRVLWDNILSETMKVGRPVWGFSEDDSHGNAAIGFSYNLMLMPELDIANFRHSMDTGSFFAFSRVDRQYRLYPEGVNMWDWDANAVPGSPAYDRHRPVLDLPVPEVTNIEIGTNSITIDAQVQRKGYAAPTVIDNDVTNGFFIDWYADGIRIHRGKTLDLDAQQLSIYNYVRAAIVCMGRDARMCQDAEGEWSPCTGSAAASCTREEHERRRYGTYGVLYTQPFEVQRVDGARTARVLPNLVSVESLRLRFELEGMSREELQLQLPAAVRITTDQCDPEKDMPRFATVKWDLSKYDPANPRETDIAGTVMLTTGIKEVTNTGNVPLGVTIVGSPPMITHNHEFSLILGEENTRLTQIGENHVLRIDLNGFFSEDQIAVFRNSEGARLTVNYLDGQNAGSGRLIQVWTNLSGSPDARTSFEFANPENTTAGHVIRSAALIATDATTTIDIPFRLIFDAASGEVASEIFLAITTNTGDTSVASNHRGSAEFARLNNAILTVSGATCICAWGEIWTDLSAPDCVTPGAREMRCSNDCDAVKVQTVPALGHDWSGWSVTTPVTCTAAGVESRTCSRCPAPSIRTIAAGCDWGEWVDDAEVPGQPTTQTRTCQRPGCGQTQTQILSEPTCPSCGGAIPCAKPECVPVVPCECGVCEVCAPVTPDCTCGLPTCETCGADVPPDCYECGLKCCAACVVGEALCGDAACAVCAPITPPCDCGVCEDCGGVVPPDCTCGICEECLSCKCGQCTECIPERCPLHPAQPLGWCIACNPRCPTHPDRRQSDCCECYPNADCGNDDCEKCNPPAECPCDNPDCETCGSSAECPCTDPECKVCNPDPDCECKNCSDCGFLGGPRGFGRVTGGSAVVVDDAIEILKWIVGLPNQINPQGNVNADAMAAAVIVTPGAAQPSVDDAIDILKWLVGLPSVLRDTHGIT